MKFAHVEMLFLIWTLPVFLLVYLYGRRKRRRVLSDFARQDTLAHLVPTGVALRRRLRAAMVLAAALLLVLAMAGPQYGYQWEKVERRGVDLVIALDCSRSMLAQDLKPTRLQRAKREIIDLLAMLQGDRAGLVAFSGTAFLQCPLTLDYAAFDIFLNALNPDYLPVGGTDLSAALKTALNTFDPQSAADKAIILITDGENTGRGDPEAAAREAAKAGVKLFCIGVGATEGVPIPSAQGGFQKDEAGNIVLSRLDEPQLTRMAVATGGAYVRSVAGDMDLDLIYRDQIRAKMENATLQSGRRQVWADRFQWPLSLAVALLFAALAVPLVRKPLIVLLLLPLPLLPAPHTAWAGPLQEGYKAYQQGQYDQALKKFIEGQVRDPDRPEVLYNVGNGYYKTGNFKAAGDYYRQALTQADPQLKPKLFYNLGNTAYRQGNLQEAVRNYQAALKLAPKDTQAKENLAFVEKQLKNPQQPQNQNKDAKQDQQQKKQQDQERQGSGNTPNKPPQQPQKADSAQPPEQQKPSQPDQAQQNPAQQDPPAQPPNQAPPQYGAQMDQPDPKQDDSRQRPNPAQAQQTPQKPAAGDQAQTPSPAAAQMLNRLKDEPGRAMMPHYEKRRVDKDW